MLTALIGHPVSHSLSPTIHAHWLEVHGIEASYRLLDVAPSEMKEAIENMRKKMPLRGMNVTVPHKERIIPYLESVDDTARAIGAVNTVVVEDGKWHGTNTDAYGFITHLLTHAPKLKANLNHAVVLGAGGAARAAVYALKQAGAARITILNRTYANAQQLGTEMGAEAAPMAQAEAMFATADLLANTTSAGMKGIAPLELPLQALPTHAVVYDIVYAPRETELLKQAAARGLHTVDGLGMLLFQAQKAFEAWWGVLPAVDAGLMQAVEDELRPREKASHA